MNWLFERLKEKSTWTALVGLLTAVGVGISTDLGDAITGAGVAVGTLCGVLFGATTSDE